MSATIKTADELHAEIMNLPCCPYRPEPDFVIGYKMGHRDARHAAAELVLASLAAERVPEPAVDALTDEQIKAIGVKIQ